MTYPAITALRRKAAAALLFATALAGAATCARAQDVNTLTSSIGTRPLGSLSGATGWINSPPLTAQQLKGHVVLVDFWDYSCINCIRSIPYIRAWADKYKAAGLIVIGVHTPEFDAEKQLANVQRAVTRFNINYPVALDNNNKIWDGFHNEYWPAHYFLDATGKVRFEHFGEGKYDESEKWIQQLLKEANAKSMPATPSSVHGQGAEAASDADNVGSPETYLGYARAQNFASPGGLAKDADKNYSVPAQLKLNQWAFSGNWNDGNQAAVLKSAGGTIVFRFRARDLHMVLGPAAGGKPVRFRITVDGQAPGENHGVDADAQGNGTVKDDRLYQLIRQKGAVKERTFTIEFLDPGVQAFTFTFG